LEEHNVADQYPERVSRMLGALEGWFESVEVERRTLPSVF